MTSSSTLVERCREIGIFEASENAVIDLLQRRSSISDDLVLSAAALAVWAHRNGHPCVYLDALAEQVNEVLPEKTDDESSYTFPSASEFTVALTSCPDLVRIVDIDDLGTYRTAATDTRPLVLVGNLLFTQRQFSDELSIAEQLATRAKKSTNAKIDLDRVNSYLPVPSADDEEAAKAGDTGIANQAAQSVVSQCLTVLTGGPGTGKTHTLTQCLALLLSLREGDLDTLDIALVAPTGKAATRAKELLNNFVRAQQGAESRLPGLTDKVLTTLSRIEPTTIQRVLGSKNRMHTRFEHDYVEHLKHDIVIVDEMSMVASYLMARLLEAIKPQATILLVGDQAQLESVESGSVLRDIVESSSNSGSAVHGRVFELLKVWRQSSDTRIGDLARHIRAGRANEATKLALEQPAGVTFAVSRKEGVVSPDVVERTVLALQEATSLSAKVDIASHMAAYELIANNKVLCGPRNGPLGVNAWNALLRERVLKQTDADLFRPGTPLLVTVNSPRSRLVNGDIGVVVNAQESDGTTRIKVFFSTEDGGRYLTPSELPMVELCYAMTVHKSQGSEYENLVVILPTSNSPLSTRELVYTAVTRAKKSLVIAGTEAAFEQAINNSSRRYSGLGILLNKLK